MAEEKKKISKIFYYAAHLENVLEYVSEYWVSELTDLFEMENTAFRPVYFRWTMKNMKAVVLVMHTVARIANWPNWDISPHSVQS